MSIKIEVTGGSIGEVADKLLAIGRSLQGAAVTFNPVMPEIEAQEAAEKPKATRKAKKAEPVEQEPEVAEQAPADPTSETKSATDAEPIENQQTTQEPSSTPAPAASASEPALDFDKDVGPVVVEAVTTHGREPVVAILNQFGAERASEVPEGQWAELVEALKAL